MNRDHVQDSGRPCAANVLGSFDKTYLLCCPFARRLIRDPGLPVPFTGATDGCVGR